MKGGKGLTSALCQTLLHIGNGEAVGGGPYVHGDATPLHAQVLGATRVTRHKNVLAERWEARIYASEDED